MIKYIIIAVCVIGAGAMGYVGERFMRPTTSAPSDQAATQELMFKMPLGKFTMQIIQSRKILHLVGVPLHLQSHPLLKSVPLQVVR